MTRFFMTIALILLFCTVTWADHHDPKRIFINELTQKVEAGVEITFLDTRNLHSWDTATHIIPGAIRVKDNATLKTLVTTLPKDRLIITYCT